MCVCTKLYMFTYTYIHVCCFIPYYKNRTAYSKAPSYQVLAPSCARQSWTAPLRWPLDLSDCFAVGSAKLEYGPRTVYAGFPSSLGLGGIFLSNPLPLGLQAYKQYTYSTYISIYRPWVLKHTNRTYNAPFEVPSVLFEMHPLHEHRPPVHGNR